VAPQRYQKEENKELKRRSEKDLKTHGNQKDIVKN
jgi:hypothetical protein